MKKLEDERQRNEEERLVREQEMKEDKANMEYETKLRDVILNEKLMKNPKAKQLDLAFEYDKRSLINEYKVLITKDLKQNFMVDLLADKADTIINARNGVPSPNIVVHSNASAPPDDNDADGDGNPVTGGEIEVEGPGNEGEGHTWQ
eukprot:CAMPEP_0114660588 /NCGR_PEP_ID=MMETSP0191-20121206/20385_1 /TAXON_ID=126664 /ORGANISM="Sorites sp." /LENGTH=146 /DNA_ID=CAMNT_0001889735 /DNA_START=759 /DNA_END=1199 /DNA_ORIENTATION=+